MDAKDLKTESALDERNNDGSIYARNAAALHCNRNKSYQDIGSNTLAKVDTQAARPCAVIGPDRVVPPPATTDAYLKKSPVEPWPCPDSIYRRLPEYPLKAVHTPNPTRNISPRQTFQENMPRIMVPPTYNAVKIHDESSFSQIVDKNVSLSKNIKSNVLSDTKYCDVPYNVNPMSNEQKNIRNPDVCVSSTQRPVLAHMATHRWPPSSVSLHTSRPYGAPELYQYPDYSSCAGPRSVSMVRPHRTITEDPSHVHSDPYYQEANIRYKPYPTIRERFPPTRYEYIGNYSNPFHPPPFPPNKYEIPKSIHPHPYPTYPHVKYLDKRMVDPIMDGYPRQANQQGNYNLPFRNQIIHPNYGPVLGSCSQNKMHPLQPDSSLKSISANKTPYENSNKILIDYGNARTKTYPTYDNYFVNEMNRIHPMKNQVGMPNYHPISMQTMPPHPYYKKENPQMKSFEYRHNLRNPFDPSVNINNPISQFSPSAIAISPTESNASNETAQTLGNSQEDCGYVSQSSTTSVRSMESVNNRLANDYYRRYYDFRYGPIPRNSPTWSRSELNTNSNVGLKDKKQIDVRQFIQMWNEGEEENAENNNSTKEMTKTGSNEVNNIPKQHETVSNQEQLYVLGLVNVSDEELSKYEHIQKVSKLPENIKGYNNIELLNQFEELTESSSLSCFKSPTPKEFQSSFKSAIPRQASDLMSRPISPLDVEAKISQSVIHKEVGCNFEIKPCSPKMLNVEIASPMQTILGERIIEKVNNPLSTMAKSPNTGRFDENRETCNILKRRDHVIAVNDNSKVSSCKMVQSPFSTNHIESAKTNYSLQDLESSSGVCLASLPRLDNDIELSFPEVNQQFINANKRESALPTAYLKDWQEIIEQSDKLTSKEKDVFHMETDLTNQLSPLIESEKEFTKLSKYRRNKPNAPENIEKYPQNKTVRTDSVIIKNPENPKNHEDNIEMVSLNAFTNETQEAPMNLTSKNNVLESDIKENHANVDDADTCPALDIAIDFSLNKTEIFPSDYNISKKETKIEKETSLWNKSHLNLIQESNDTTSTPFTYQQFEENTSTFGNSVSGSHGMMDVPTIPVKNDEILEADTDISLSCKENVTKLSLDVISEKNIRDVSAQGINSNIICSNLNANLVSSVILENENDLSKLDKNSKHTSNDGSMEIDNEDKKIKSDEKKYDANSSSIGESLEKNNVIQPTQIAYKESTIEFASNSNTSLQISSDDREAMHKLELYYDETVIGSPKEQVKEIKVKSETRINMLECENIAPKESTQILHTKDGFTGKTRIYKFENNIIQNSHKEKTEFFPNRIEHSTRKTDELFSQNQCRKSWESLKPAKRYFCKELYSPWIQKLLMFDEGLCLNIKDIDDKKVDISHSDHNVYYMTGTMDNKKDKLMIGELQSERIEVEIEHRSFIDNISAIVETSPEENGITDLQSNVIKDEVDQTRVRFHITNLMNRGVKETNIKQEQQEIIKDETNHDCNRRDIVDNGKEDGNINNFETEIIKGECYDKRINKLNQGRRATSAEEVQPEVSKDQFSGSCERNERMADIYDKSEKENNYEQCQQQIINGNLGYNGHCLDNNIDIVNNSGKESSLEKLQQEVTVNTIIQNKCSDKITNIIDNSKEGTSVEESQPEITKGKFDKNCTSIGNITDRMNNYEEKSSIEEMQKEIMKIGCSDNGYVINDSRKESSTEESQPEITKDELDHKIDCTDYTKDVVDSSINISLSAKVFKGDFNRNSDSPPIIADIMLYRRDETETGELQPKNNSIECDNNCEFNDDISKIADNYQKTSIDKLQPKIQTVKYDHDCEFISQITNMTESYKENIIDEMKPNITDIEFDRIPDYTDTILKLKLGNNDKEETSKEKLQPLTNLECKHNHECQIEDVSLGNMSSKILNEFDDNRGSKDVITDIVDSETNETNVERLTDLIKDDFEDDSISKAETINVQNNINNILENKLPEDHKTNANIIKSSTNYDIKCQTNKEILCYSPKPTKKSFSNDVNPTERIKDHNELGDRLRTFASLSKTSEDHEIKTPENPDKLDMNFDDLSFKHVPFKNQQLEKHRFSLKRSFSDSALNSYNEEKLKQDVENISFLWPIKRKKTNHIENIEPDIIAENLHNIIQNNRRNSISSIYNEDNVSFCILIDNNCLITEGTENEKICFTELSEDCIAEIDSTNEEEHAELMPNIVISTPQEHACEYSDPFIMECDAEKCLEESWVEDVACVETVVSDDIAHDIIISAPTSPKDVDLAENNESDYFSSNISEHTDKVKYIYGGKMCSDDVNLLETLYNTPQMDVNKTLTYRECQILDNTDKYYDKESLEKILSESNGHEILNNTSSYTDSSLSTDILKLKAPNENANVNNGLSTPLDTKSINMDIDMYIKRIEQNIFQSEIDIMKEKTQDDTVHSFESSIDNVFTYEKEDEGASLSTSSSPEVSSTTSEERNSCILLKITNYKGSRVSQINDIKAGNRSSCKYTEKKDYSQSRLPLITKAAQKYIPPLRESIPDLKVKLSLPQQSLIKLKQLKISKVKPKVNKHNSIVPIIPKKPKPKFEDVLKSIDEIQFKMHKEKSKKTKNIIPKVVIKKTKNGSHYASTSNKETFNPDLTGRKWQPWVFIEKSHFIDKMAIKNKTRAVYNHRKNTYVLAEKFRKYKSVSNTKFIISQPKLDNTSKGHLKYTIRLKHNY